jgi:hypothetical protein
VKTFTVLSLAALSIPAGAQAQGSSQDYYSFEPPASERRYRPSPVQEVETKAAEPKGFVTEYENAKPVAKGSMNRQSSDEAVSSDAASGGHVSLPPNMEKGVKDLEVGMDELRVYTGAMTVHVQQNGLRGFLAVTPELKKQGSAVGHRIGGGIGGIMTDVGRDMLVPGN